MIRPLKIDRVSDLVVAAGALRPKTVVIAGGDRPEDIRLVESARDHGIVDRCILVGDGQRIRRALKEVKISMRARDIIATSSDKETAARVVECQQQGWADIILKGDISTPTLNRAMLKIVVRPTISLVTMFDLAPVRDGRPMLLTDPGVTTVCNYGRMVGLIENAVDVARHILGIERPRVALLSANEKVIDSLPSTKLAEALTRRRWPNAVVYGPLSFDLAVSEESVRLKGMPRNEVAGRADILVCPSIDAANILYKVMMETVNYGLGTFAGITVGVGVPYVILSRADNVETKLQSVALCSIAAEYLPMKRAAAPAKVGGRQWRVFLINPGASSTKLALFKGGCMVQEAEVAHAPEIQDRSAEIEQFIARHNIGAVDAVVGRGGFLPRPKNKMAGGVYRVDAAMVKAITERAERKHASNLGIPLAAAVATRFEVPAFVVDPVMVDEFSPVAEISGMAGITRQSVGHVLSVHGAAEKAAEKIGLPVGQVNLVVAHLGSGFTIAAVRAGRIVDSSIALLGEGPFTPQRAGQLPTRELVELCYSGRFTKEQLFEELTLRGGLRSYLGDNRMENIEKRIAAGDKHATLIVDAMIYQIAKAIGAMCIATGPDVEGIVLTGGLARSELVVRGLKDRVSHLAPMFVLEETTEMERMAVAAGRVLDGTEKPRRYAPPTDRRKKP